MKLRRKLDADGKPYGWEFWCAACKRLHIFSVEQGAIRWTFNGNVDQPTFKPSMLHYVPEVKIDGKTLPQRTTCHFHLVNGVQRFCKDSPGFGGQSFPLQEIPADV